MRQTRLVKNYIYNTLYQVLLLIAPLITTPYISRILGVTNIGIYQYSQANANYFVLIGTIGTSLYGQREIAYLQDKPKERSNAFVEIEILRIATSTICIAIYFLIFCTHGIYSEIYTILTLEIMAAAIDISWFFMGMEDFKITVIRNTIIKLVGILCVFIFVKRVTDLWIYTLCVTAPLFIGNISLWFSLRKYIVKNRFNKNHLKGIQRRLKPVLILFLPQIATNVYLLLDKTMIGKLGTNIDQVGYYSQAQKIVQIVLTLGISLGAVMLPAMSALYAKGDFESILKNIRVAFRFTYMLCFALLFGLCSIANRFVPLFFGKGYEPVTKLIIIISPVIIIISLSSIIGKQYLLPTHQQEAFTASILAGACSNFILNIVLIRFYDSLGASIATVIAELVVTIVQCWYVRKQLPLKEFFLLGRKYLFFGIIMYNIIKIVEAFLPTDSALSIFIMIIIGIIVYVSELVITKDPVIIMGLKIMKKKKY